MKKIYISLATEDVLSEHIIRKIVSNREGYEITKFLGGRGNDYLRNMVNDLNSTATAQPVILLTDLDRNPCPPGLIEQWLKKKKHPCFLFRVAVREIESWVLASSEKFKAFFKLNGANIPINCDSIDNPKEFLINLVKKSRDKRLREEVVPQQPSTANKGYAYNQCLCEFVSEHWDEKEAILHSESLRRCIKSIENLQNGA